MDSIEDMFLKLLVRGMNPSGHFGAFKGLLFYGQIIFSQPPPKNAILSRFQNASLPCELPAGQPGQGLPPQGGRAGQADLSPTPPRSVTHTTQCPLLPAELHKQVDELPMATPGRC